MRMATPTTVSTSEFGEDLQYRRRDNVRRLRWRLFFEALVFAESMRRPTPVPGILRYLLVGRLG